MSFSKDVSKEVVLFVGHKALHAMHLKAMLHEAIFLATCNATMTNKNLSSCRGDVTCKQLVSQHYEKYRVVFLQLAMQQLQLQNGVLHEAMFRAPCNAMFSCKKH